MLAPPKRFVARVLRRAVFDAASIDEAHLERAYALAQDLAVRRAFAGVYASAIEAFAGTRALRAHFGRYTGPVFCAWGRHDRYIPLSSLRAVRRVYPNASTLVLNRSGHLPMLEEPLRLGAALNSFLDPSRSA
jgi:pimeloyl-ACP methyl ester carboxylesterase